MTVRVLLADDHGVLRGGLRTLLNEMPGYQVVGEAADGGEAVRLAEELRPDLALLDISMPMMDGIEVTRVLKGRQPDVTVLILTVHEDEQLLREAIKAGAAGYVVKKAAQSELLSAMEAALRGDLYVHPAMTRALLAPVSNQQVLYQPSEEVLTRREVQVLALIAQGYTNMQIAEALVVSIRTVESHRANIMSKLGVHNRAELVRYAIQHGVLSE
ncbi:MAG TPA: response regulator transcription factor [Anaerolineae bacterium]